MVEKKSRCVTNPVVRQPHPETAPGAPRRVAADRDHRVPVSAQVLCVVHYDRAAVYKLSLPPEAPLALVQRLTLPALRSAGARIRAAHRHCTQFSAASSTSAASWVGLRTKKAAMTTSGASNEPLRKAQWVPVATASTAAAPSAAAAC